jgi:PAS domain S-box-containing protein
VKIGTKILWTLLGLSVVMALGGAFAVSRQRAASALGAAKEAESVAGALSLLIEADTEPSRAISKQVISRLYETLGRDVEVVDRRRMIVADVIPSEIGTRESDLGDLLDATLRDGKIQTKFTNNPGHGMRQVAVPIRTQSGEIEGAVVVEYSSFYDEMMAATNKMLRQVIIASLGGVSVTALLALYLGTSIATPLRQLTKAAAGFAAGQSGLPMPGPRKDEIGDLTLAFKVMMERRQRGEEELLKARGELETRVTERTSELATANERLQEEVIDRRKAEEAAHQGEERVRQLADDLERERKRIEDIVNGLPAVVFEHWQTRASFVSSYVETMFGYTLEEWLSTPDFWCQRVHPDDKQWALENLPKILASGVNHREKNQFRWVRKDGRIIWTESYMTVICDPVDGAIGIRGFMLDVTEHKKAEEDLIEAHKQLVETSREAGMAEVATNVLHNVGNVLNSVNISAGVVADQVRQSSTQHLSRVSALLKENEGNLGAFLTTDPAGQKLPRFISQLTEQLETEKAELLKELEQLGKNVEHIKDIVAVQQNYASAAGMSHTVGVIELIEDSLRMNAGALMRHDVQLIREYEARPVLQVDKHKVMQVLVNLVRNAKYACDESGRLERRLTVRVTKDERAVRIAVMDNGVGIPPENMTRIFSHGFTTRDKGHGFGLHSSALAAHEMGGALLATSDGAGRGATFTLELPIEPNQSTNGL